MALLLIEKGGWRYDSWITERLWGETSWNGKVTSGSNQRSPADGRTEKGGKEYFWNIGRNVGIFLVGCWLGNPGGMGLVWTSENNYIVISFSLQKRNFPELKRLWTRRYALGNWYFSKPCLAFWWVALSSILGGWRMFMHYCSQTVEKIDFQRN